MGPNETQTVEGERTMGHFHIKGSIGSIFSNAVAILDSDTCPMRVHAMQHSISWLAPRKVAKCSRGGALPAATIHVLAEISSAYI
jgi:hypothetical protein